jgi:hypothetical protein
MDRLFWTTLRRVYSGWTDALIIVKPETVVSWHRAGFRLFWRWRSRQSGRPQVISKIRDSPSKSGFTGEVQSLNLYHHPLSASKQL